MFDVIVNDSNGNRVKTFRCPVAECSIGKARDNFIQLKGWRVAGHHAEIRRTPEGLFVEDKTGQARIEVNGVEVEHFGPLKSTDVINVAGYQITAGIIQDPAAKPAAASATAGAARSAEVEEDEDDDLLKTAIGVSRHAAIEESEQLSKTIVSLMHNEKFKWRNRVHDELLQMMDLRRTDIGSMDESALRAQVKEMVREIIKGMGDKLPSDLDREALATEVLNEAVGLGPLEKLLADDSVTEIMVNKFDDIYVEKAGKLTKSDVTFSSDNAVMTAIERIVSPLGRRIDESSPMVDARLKDGSRVNAIIPPLALRGPCLTIRKFAKSKLQAEDLIRFGAINEAMVQFLKMAVKHKRNVIISGGTGSGKTTTLNVLSNFIPENERIVTVEDAAELKLAQPHLVSLEARPPNLEGKGAVPIRDLVKNCLRMRPDRIVVGECRGGETLDMLQAMNTGHDGSLTTAHANTPRDLIARLETMVMMAGMDLPLMAIREQVASAIHLIVQQTRFTDGSRRIIFISEITGVESGIVQLQDIFKYQQEGFDDKGRVTGRFMATGAVPEFYEDLRQRGLNVDMSIFKQ